MNAPRFAAVMQAARHARIEIYDYIGPEWFGMISEQTVARAISGLGQLDKIEVRINSMGGSAYIGIAIYNLLKQHPAQVVVYIDGLAASVASLIAMAGDTIHAPKNSALMIHDPMVSVSMGREAELDAAKSQLATCRKNAISVYAARTGKAESEIAAMMQAETWMTGEEAVAQGFADTVEAELTIPEPAPIAQQAPALMKAVPDQFSRLVALCAAGPVPKEPAPMTTPAPAAPLTTPAPAPVAPAPAPTPQPVLQAPAAPVAPVDSAAIVKAERERIASLTVMCAQAGSPERLQKFVDDGVSVDVARAALWDVVCAKQAPVGDTAMTTGANDPHAKYRAEYQAQLGVHTQMNVSEDAYVATRCRDDGLVPPAKK